MTRIIGTHTMPDFHCPNHPNREVAWRGEFCVSCKLNRVRGRERYRANTGPLKLIWLAVGLALIGLAMQAAFGAHEQVKLEQVQRRTK